MSDLLCVAAVARRLGVSVRLVTRWIDEGELRAIEGVGRGRGLRVAPEWLDAFIEVRERVASVPAGPRHARGGVECDPSDERFASVRDARAKLLGGAR
jgi:excisionase family DNA binding protein